jgi:hypothetical protein
MVSKPPYETARVLQVVALLFEVDTVHEVLDELEIGHPDNLLSHLTGYLYSNTGYSMGGGRT